MEETSPSIRGSSPSTWQRNTEKRHENGLEKFFQVLQLLLMSSFVFSLDLRHVFMLKYVKI